MLSPKAPQHWGTPHTRGTPTVPNGASAQSAPRDTSHTPEEGCSRELNCALERIKLRRLLSFCFTYAVGAEFFYLLYFPRKEGKLPGLSRQLHRHPLLRDPSPAGQPCAVLPRRPPHRCWWPSQASSALAFSWRAFLRSLRRAAWCRARSSSPLRHCSTMAKLKRQKVLELP